MCRVGETIIRQSWVTIHLCGIRVVIANRIITSTSRLAKILLYAPCATSASVLLGFRHYLLWTLFNRMIRDPVLLWASVGLILVLAFILLPTYERFKDASGRDVDIAPGAPAIPEELIPIDERTGEKVNVPHTGYEYQSWLNKESYKNIFGAQEPSASVDPIPKGGEIFPTGMYENKRIGEDYLARESFGNWFVWPIRESFEDSMKQEPVEADLPQNTTVTVIPPPVMVQSTKPSGVKAMPSQDMPANKYADVDIPEPASANTFNKTLPPPDFSKPHSGEDAWKNQYVKKSSLVPCTCPAQGMSCPQHAGSYPSSSVPGSMNEDDNIKKPFSVAFPGETNPIGYLNSFAAFSK